MSGRSITRSGDLHSSKKQRLLLLSYADDVVGTYQQYMCTAEEDKKARNLLQTMGFDPDNINKACRIVRQGPFLNQISMICYYGNFNMCQYLLSRGADGCKTQDLHGWSPMYVAAANGHLEIVRFLSQDGGAHEDIQKINICGDSPLRAALRNDHDSIVHWLILNGALFLLDDSNIDDTMLRNHLYPIPWFPMDYDRRLNVLSWAKNAVTVHDNFKIFLTGTILPLSSFRRHPKNQYATRSTANSAMKSSPLVVFKGTSGILEVIADYAGKPNARDVRTLRQLLALLPVFIDDTPFESFEDTDDDDLEEEDDNNDY